MCNFLCTLLYFEFCLLCKKKVLNWVRDLRFTELTFISMTHHFMVVASFVEKGMPQFVIRSLDDSKKDVEVVFETMTKSMKGNDSDVDKCIPFGSNSATRMIGKRIRTNGCLLQ